jgi:dynein heavy chain
MVSHLSRVARVINKPQGHGLLVGLGGNGRTSISRLASFVNDCSTLKIELHKAYGVPEWREDLRTLYKSLGIDNKKIAFNFSDREIRDEVFVEDINSILNVGELTSLFSVEDIDEINYEVSQQFKKK